MAGSTYGVYIYIRGKPEIEVSTPKYQSVIMAFPQDKAELLAILLESIVFGTPLRLASQNFETYFSFRDIPYFLHYSCGDQFC
jgi:hypothetical protein